MMNRMMRSFGLFLLATSAGCAAQLGAPGEEGGGNDLAATAAAGPVYGEREGTPFSPRVLSQLEKRGIKVADEDAERTTVEQQWIVPGNTWTAVQESNPLTTPQRYATQLDIRLPRSVVTPNKDRSCSGTLIDNDAVLTAAHCLYQWREIRSNLMGNPTYKLKVLPYSITVYPRRNGHASLSEPHGPYYVKKSFWDFTNWPSADRDGYAGSYDYGVARLKRQVPLPTASLRVPDSPTGMSIRMAHYPFATTRTPKYGMFYSEGSVGAAHDTHDDVFWHSAGSEPGTSGAGVFETGANNVIGVHVASEGAAAGTTRRPGQTRYGTPNEFLALTPSSNSDIFDWVNAPL